MEINAKVRVEVDGTVTVQLPNDVPAGKYEGVLLPVDGQGQKWDAKQAAAWERLSKKVEQLHLSPQPAKTEYHKGLIERHRKQGLEL